MNTVPSSGLLFANGVLRVFAPAKPVTESARSAPASAAAPRAISRAQGAEISVCAAIVDAETPRKRLFASLE